jgi:hypothetical protein
MIPETRAKLHLSLSYIRILSRTAPMTVMPAIPRFRIIRKTSRWVGCMEEVPHVTAPLPTFRRVPLVHAGTCTCPRCPSRLDVIADRQRMCVYRTASCG